MNQTILYRFLILIVLLLKQQFVIAAFNITTTNIQSAIPIAIIPFIWNTDSIDRMDSTDSTLSTIPVNTNDPTIKQLPKLISTIITTDLFNSGRFKTLKEEGMLKQPQIGADIDFSLWNTIGQKALVLGKIYYNSSNNYRLRFQILDVQNNSQIMDKWITIDIQNIRATAHKISDIIYEQFIGIPGAFTSQIAYITTEAHNNPQILLNVADIDGHNDQTILSSNEPLLSPAWSPNSNKLAYVSLEQQQCTIYIQDLHTGIRKPIPTYSGINSAPAWSPDGQRLALVLSKDGNPEIYIFDFATKKLSRITNHISIDTEPSWSPDGSTIAFTSDRGGTPQIYTKPVNGRIAAKRLTFEGDYNANPVYSPDGKFLAFVTHREGASRIGLLNLATGKFEEMTPGPLDESPSFLSNGSMIIYATQNN
ncbi:hypothetical protein TI05_10130, partial [Achromatium sp. WMS3]